MISDPDRLADSRRFAPDDTELHDLPPLGAPPPDTGRHAQPADSRRFTPHDTEIQDSERLPQLADSRRFTPHDTELHDLPPLGAPPPRPRESTQLQDSERLPEVDETLVQAPNESSEAQDAPHAEDELPVADGRVAHYRLRRELARGGMGAVYLAYHPRLKREVALKVMLAGRDASSKQLARFQREAEAAGRLQHPGIVAVHDVGHDRGLHYLVMDLVPGPSLDKVIEQEGPLAPRRAAEIARALAEALAYAHSRAVLHRDMKPANVLLDPERGPRITDFGLAKTLDVEDELTKAGAIMGTPAYMPPEQARGDPQQVDRRADVYSLGATLYAMLTGAAPFKGQPVRVIYQVLRVDPTPVRKLRAEVDRDLETICLRCLEKDPQARYLTAGELAQDLARYLAHEPILARPPSPRERLVKWVRRNRALASVLAGAAALLLALGGTALVVLPRRERARVAAEARDAAQRSAAAAAAAPPTALGPPLAALQAAQRWRDAAPTDPEATRALFDAAARLGEVALSGEQWELAQQCFSQARELEVDVPAAEAGLARVDAARERLARERREEILALLARAREGELAREPEGLLNGVFALVRYPEPQTAELLAAELDDVSARLLEVERDALLGAVGGATDSETVARLEALFQRRAQPGQELLGDEDARLYREVLSAWAERDEVSARQQLLHLGNLQRDALGPRLDAARIACDALGRIGILGPSERALARYLEAEADPSRGAVAARALVRLRSTSGRAYVVRALGTWGLTSRYAAAVLPLLDDWEDPHADPNSAPQLWTRGTQHMQHGRLHEARADFERVLQLEPHHAGAWANLASILQTLGEADAAREAFDTALGMSPKDPLLRFNHAEFLRRAGEPQAALEAYGRAIELAPGLARNYRQRGTLLQELGDLDAASRDLDEALRLDPADPDVLVARGDLAYQRQDLERARADYERALRLNPSHLEALKNRGWVSRMQGDPEGALADLSRVLELDPTHVQAWDMRGNVHTDLQDLPAALRDFARAVELDPQQAGPLTRRAFTYMSLEDWDAALADFEAAVALAPGFQPALHGRADALRISERYAEAIAAYDALLAAFPDSLPGWNSRGVCLFLLGRYPEAVASYERALALDPSIGALWFNKGESLASDGRWIQALEALDEALERDPRSVDALVLRGDVHAHEGRHALARDDADAALELAPDHVPALLLRARALRALDEPSLARQDLLRALELAPGHPEATQALAELGAQ
ncbi:MAG: tetratricopeptide repeat protein [Planctomycetota bacterium]